MPTAGLLLLIATLLPLASSILLAILGRRMGRPLAGWVATALVAGSAACSLGGMIAWFNGGQLSGLSWGPGDKPIEISFKWLPIGSGIAQDHPGFVDVVIYIDSLTVALFNAISLIALLVHAHAVASESDDENFARVFANLGLLVFASLGVAISGSLLQIFVFWQLLSVASYLLNAFRYEDAAAVRGAQRTFLIGAAADVGFLLAIVVLTHTMGNLTLSDLTRLLRVGATPPAPIAHSTRVFVGLLLFISAATKARLFPLRGWQASAASTSADASALLQTIAGSAAGIILLARTLPLIPYGILWLILIAGLVSWVAGALIAMVQTDVDQVLAWGTTSQMGLLFLAIGLGSWIGALFQLFSHIFFKSLLFVSTGNVISAGEGSRELSRYGGLMRARPLTAVAMGIGALAMAGAPFTSGYFSQEMVMTHAGAFALAGSQGHHGWWYWIFFIVPMAGVCAATLAIVRCWMLIFWGKPRTLAEYAPSDPRTSLWLPVAALGVMSIIGGSRLLEIKPILAQAVSETENYCYAQQENPAHPPGSFLQAWPVDTELRGEPDETHPADAVHARLDESARLFREIYPWSFGVGLGLGLLLYLQGFAGAEILMKLPPVRFLHSVLTGRFMADRIKTIGMAGEKIGLVRAKVESHAAGARVADYLRRVWEELGWSGR